MLGTGNTNEPQRRKIEAQGMWVNGPTRLGGVNAKTSAMRKSGGGGGFSLQSTDQPTRTAGSAASAGSVHGIEALMALQGIDDPLTGKKRRAVRRGLDILDILEEMKLDLLSGRISAERLARLAGIVDRYQDSGDPEVNAVIAEIELRALVELAKLGR